MEEKKLNHLAIIMDGNGRWAKARGYDRTMGHIKGARVAKKIIEASAEMNLPHLTLYAFSTENWLRPQLEVSFLMRLLFKNLKRERKSLIKNNIKFNAIGDLEKLPKYVQDEVQESIDATKDNTGMVLTFALSYGGQQEIVEATKNIVALVKKGEISEDQIDKDLFSKALPSNPLPEADLIIRTSGESRLSNFLLWQAAYAEFMVTQKFWPDFTIEDLNESINYFFGRERRYGRISEQLGPNNTYKVDQATLNSLI